MCGLVILTGPLSLIACAQQGYVDVEAERAAAQAAGGSATSASSAAPVSNDPYGAQPAQAYPATSYGASNAPAATSSIAPVSSSVSPSAMPASAPTDSSMGGSELGNMFLQIQRLQEEVMRLNGKVEEQAYELSTLKEQSLQRYMDLDKRLGSGGAPATSGDPSTQTSSPVGAEGINAAGPLTPETTANTAPGVEQPGEADAYRSAYALVQGRQFEQAIPAFQQFLQRFPGGIYAANAHYWLGELYLVKEPPDLEASRQSFALLLSQYPDNSKAADALYKLGKVQFLKGNREKAKEYLDLVIVQYEGTNNAVVKLARDFIAQNY